MDEFKLPEFFFEIFDPSLPRLGPGNAESTRRAIEWLGADRQPGRLRILDLGCGNGTQTIQLARATGGEITALDNHQPFLDELNRRAAAQGVATQIHTVCKDMRTLGEADGQFDLIWSEGALSLFIPSFGHGLAACRERLVPGGKMAVSDLSWFEPDAPPPLREYFDQVYPEITDIQQNLALMERTGFKVLGHFNLPESDWREDYFRPLAARLDALREQYPGEPDKLALIESLEHEREIYRQYSRWYGYTFYLLERK